MQRLRIRKTALCFVCFIVPKLQLIGVANVKHMLNRLNRAPSLTAPSSTPTLATTCCPAHIHVIVRDLCTLYTLAELFALVVY